MMYDVDGFWPIRCEEPLLSSAFSRPRFRVASL